MALTQQNNYITTLLNHSSDAQGNLFYVTFSPTTAMSGSDGSGVEDMTIRCSGINIPATEQGTYSVKFMNATVDRPNAKVELNRQFDITFRVDSNYEVYRKLILQERVTFDPIKGYTATNIDDKTNLFDISVSVPKITKDTANTPAGEATKEGTIENFEELFRFKHCWISSVDNVSYKYGSSDPLTVKATIQYIYFEDDLAK